MFISFLNLFSFFSWLPVQLNLLIATSVNVTDAICPIYYNCITLLMFLACDTDRFLLYYLIGFDCLFENALTIEGKKSTLRSRSQRQRDRRWFDQNSRLQASATHSTGRAAGENI